MHSHGCEPLNTFLKKHDEKEFVKYHTNIFFYLTHYFEGLHRLMYEKSNSYVYIHL